MKLGKFEIHPVTDGSFCPTVALCLGLYRGYCGRKYIHPMKEIGYSCPSIVHWS